ncbi:Nif3-like dinuclear metal center hexameric protein [Paenibacillus crassostreae]|uniref:GTP cyclohydrolase 1 type 2 homolog n=1 Tax=Paenibacillus crassostreae TaxID=1763538 RepID=A0A167FUM5_9BACL|nr:Nif3-like dinuclear metal center hexameric protein [Paenibacillus crassostreae]AOZ94046.1 transcriptional regulator [Paenibacillus crassostreae]OAB76917.1 transcriptional regulator [Paenibacillus crassostreae]
MSTTISDILQALKEPVDRIEAGVDVLCYGDPNDIVTGIATAFVASHDVIVRAKSLGVNLLITHEGLFYSHFGNKQLSAEDPVVREKQKFIEESGMAIFRYHDHIHKYQPDGIMTGLLQELEWNGNVEKHTSFVTILNFDNMTVHEVANHLKNKLNIQQVRVVGDTSMPCRRVGLLVGYRGGGEQVIPLYERENLDLIIYGEGPEWETPEYVRDAVFQKRKKALIVLGHAESEWPGMKYLVNWIQSEFPSIPVHFISEKPVFQIL